MKPIVKDVDIKSNLTGYDVEMKLDENATAELMDVLTGLYSDEERALIREYSTNARDAHLHTGIVRPSEVETPNSLSPTRIIRDFGEGLSKDDIIEVYSKYGASTKRDSNEYVGMLGLGCKSALTYTDQFSLVAV